MNQQSTANRAYWERRRKQETEWMQQNLAQDDQVNKKIADYYQRAIDEINQTIDANARLLVDEQGNQTGYKTVSKEQMEAYQREAKALVDQANQMRANGHRPTYDDFPTEVNRRMRVYNATMRINRLELLKSRLGTILLPATMQTDWDLQDRLSGDYIAECKRQAGIMEVTARPTMWTQAKVAKIVMAQTGGATFSQRLWANQDALKARLDQVVANGIIQGQNPREMARRLKSQVRDTIVNQRYVTERIARTESARVQFTAQLNSIKANGYQYVQWFAEIRACSECKAIANRNNGYGPGIYKVDEVPDIPVHPNCRCSIGETWVDGREDNLKPDKSDKITVKQAVSNLARLYDVSNFKWLKPNSEDEVEYNRLSKQWADQLPEDQQNAMIDYVRDSPHDINAYILGRRITSETFGWTKASQEAIDARNQQLADDAIGVTKALASFELPEDIIVRRNIDDNEYKALLEISDDQKIHEFDRYKSTTPFDGDYEGGDYDINYYVPKGVKGAYLDGTVGYEDEKEFLIDKGQKFTVVKGKGKEVAVYVYPDNEAKNSN